MKQIKEENNVGSIYDTWKSMALKIPVDRSIIALAEKDPEVIVNGNTTILKFNKDEKYISKTCKEDTFDIEKGILMCIAKKAGYTSSDLRRLVKNAKYQKVKEKNNE